MLSSWLAKSMDFVAAQPWVVDRRVCWAAAAILVASIALRVVVIAAAHPNLVSDARDYRSYAMNLVQTGTYAQTYEEGETEVYKGFTFRAYRPPGYAILLAGLYEVFGECFRSALAVNVMADVVTEVCFFLIALRLFGGGAAVIVLSLLAVHIVWTPNPMSESVYTAMSSLLMVLLVYEGPTRSAGSAAAFGLLLAAALFTRPITVFVLPLLGWKFARSGFARRQLMLAALVLMPSVVTLGWWTYRNYRLFGQVVAFTTNLGANYSMHLGINRDEWFTKMRQAGLNEAEINAEFLRMEREVCLERPGFCVSLVGRQAAGLFSIAPCFEVYYGLWEMILPGGPGSSLGAQLHRAAFRLYGPTYLLAAMGVLILAIQRKRLGGVWTLMISYVVIHAILSRGDMRYAAPIYPMMCLFAAACLWMLSVDLFLSSSSDGPAEISPPTAR
ncbi:MAG: hypothetical protein IT442_05990 [Phycisphaeraceae bacterium]|nr:hypothetical protein [Phycisphaeraceae bacterium]